MSEENKRIARRYHKLDPGDVEEILAPDFIGRHNETGFTWNREEHIQFWTDHRDVEDVIHQQIAEGDWVATRFTRKGTIGGQYREIETMHFKRFEGAKIAEVWEYFDQRHFAG